MNRIIDRDRAIDVAIQALKWAANQGEQVDEEEAMDAIATITTPAPAGQVGWVPSVDEIYRWMLDTGSVQLKEMARSVHAELKALRTQPQASISQNANGEPQIRLSSMREPQPQAPVVEGLSAEECAKILYIMDGLATWDKEGVLTVSSYRHRGEKLHFILSKRLGQLT